jgi:hypothetical protein
LAILTGPAFPAFVVMVRRDLVGVPCRATELDSIVPFGYGVFGKRLSMPSVPPLKDGIEKDLAGCGVDVDAVPLALFELPSDYRHAQVYQHQPDHLSPAFRKKK